MTAALQIYVAKTIARGKIGFGDVRRLFRVLLPAGIETREEAELLAVLDRSVSSVDPTWSEWFVNAFVYFVISSERPRASVYQETADWLRQLLAGDRGPTPRGQAILLQVARETEGAEGPRVAVSGSECRQSGTTYPCR